MELHTRNVNTAFYDLCARLKASKCAAELQRVSDTTLSQDSRNGKVIRFRRPVMLHYSHPTERVLFNTARNCNHFFHLVEAVWMLAGRNDVALLKIFNKKMTDYSDDGTTFHGAYGYRWFAHGLIESISALAFNHDDRRCYIPLFAPTDNRNSKDVCCNVGIVFEIQEGVLNMSIFNRSNDIIWGALGANYVHFTILQEVVARYIGVTVGYYTQISTNFHMYEWNSNVEEWWNVYLDSLSYQPLTTAQDELRQCNQILVTRYPESQPIDIDIRRCHHLDAWLDTILNFFQRTSNGDFSSGISYTGVEWVDYVVRPAIYAWGYFKAKKYDHAIRKLETITSDDWRIGCLTYIENHLTKLSNREKPLPNIETPQSPMFKHSTLQSLPPIDPAE